MSLTQDGITVVAVYTGQGLAPLVQDEFRRVFPQGRLINIIDDSLIHDVLEAQMVTSALQRRLFQYFVCAQDTGADLIVSTCSSVGEAAEAAQPFLDIPIRRIDWAMAEQAVRRFTKVGVLATLPSTLEPTMRLLERIAAEESRPIEVVSGLAEGAYQALVGGQPEVHDARITEAAEALVPQVEALVLAQGSMARMQAALEGATRLPVLSSPRLCFETLREEWGADAHGL